MRIGTLTLVYAAAALGSMMITPAAWAGRKFVEFDVPGAADTFPLDINNGNAVVGYYEYQSGIDHGFVRNPDGTIATFDPPGATSSAAGSINDRGEIAGSFDDALSIHGFLRSAEATFTIFDPLHSTSTISAEVNDKGAVAGSFYDSNNTAHGFLRKRNGGFVTFDAADGVNTYVRSVNAKRVATGDYCQSPCYPQTERTGFVRYFDGAITSFKPPNANQTHSISINSTGSIAGFYSEPAGGNLGFLRTGDGQIVTFDASGENVNNSVSDMNDKGWITGNYEDYITGVYHGFLRAPDGTITIFDDHKAGDGIGEGTQPTAINNKRFVTGYYSNEAGVYHGFIVRPKL